MLEKLSNMRDFMDNDPEFTSFLCFRQETDIESQICPSLTELRVNVLRPQRRICAGPGTAATMTRLLLEPSVQYLVFMISLGEAVGTMLSSQDEFWGYFWW